MHAAQPRGTTTQARPGRRPALAVAGLLLSACNAGSVAQPTSTATSSVSAEAPVVEERSVQTPLHVRPVISNLLITISRDRCFFVDSDIEGRFKTLRVTYADVDGNVSGGTLLKNIRFSGRSTQTTKHPIPSRFVTITGRTAGQVTLTTCIRFGEATGFTESVQLIDAAGKRSNVLSRTIIRPSGVPETRRSGDRPALESAAHTRVD